MGGPYRLVCAADRSGTLRMNLNFLDFEQPIAELEAKIDELRLVGVEDDGNITLAGHLNELRAVREVSGEIYRTVDGDREIEIDLDVAAVVAFASHG